MQERNLLSKQDVKRLQTRLTAEFLTEKTNIFRNNGHDLYNPRMAFKEYWSTWVAPELAQLFDQVHFGRKVVEKPIDYELLPVRLHGRIIGTNIRIGDHYFTWVKGGVQITGPHGTFTRMNSWYTDEDIDRL